MKTFKVRAGALITVSGLVLLGAGISTAQASKPSPNHKVTLCHRTGSVAGGNLHNGYTKITVDIASVANAKDTRGHDHHEQVGNGHGGDIIPAYQYKTFKYAGKNLDNGGQALLDRDCMKVTPATSTTKTTSDDDDDDDDSTTTSTTSSSTTSTGTSTTTTGTSTSGTSTSTDTATTGTSSSTSTAVVAGTGTSTSTAAPAATATVKVAGAGAAVNPQPAAAGNPLPAAAAAGEANVNGQLALGGFLAFAAFLAFATRFMLRRRNGEV